MSGVEIDDLVTALRSYVDAEYEERKAREAYTGYSWGWAGSALISERDHAAKLLGDRLNAYIDQRVYAALSRYSEAPQ